MSLLLAFALCTLSTAQYVDLVTFDGNPSTTSRFWDLINDPVMGGVSYSNWTVDKVNQKAVWIGSVEIVPSLNAPGFCNIMSEVKFYYNNASGFKQLQFRARSSIPYQGFKVSFGADTLDLEFKCFKADFTMKSTGDWEDIAIDFNQFSNDWSQYTGEPITKCGPDHPEVCPTDKDLAAIRQIGFWMEGAEGEFDWELQYVRAGNPAQQPLQSGWTNECSASMPKDLLYNVNAYTAADVGLPNGTDNELLSEAICCDPVYTNYAEPNGFYSFPDVGLLRKMNQTGITVFYDSVCGIPVFQAPIGRTFDDWVQETKEHGWPSFRTEETFLENVVVLSDGVHVKSKCGTALGSYLPDANGPRYCIDLSCISHP